MDDMQLEPTGAAVVGPFDDYRVSYNHYQVPHVSAHPLDDGTYNIVVDRRFGIHRPVTQEELENWLPILAHAMAVAAGFTCHGENSKPINPYKSRMIGISLPKPPTTMTVIDGGKE